VEVGSFELAKPFIDMGVKTFLHRLGCQHYLRLV